MKSLTDGKNNKFTIEKIDNIVDYDCCVRQYRNAIINVMINLRSKHIFEIGSFIFQTARAISYYLNKYEPAGKLITADITTWNRGEPPDKVYPVMFWPYDEDPSLEHGQMNVYYNNYTSMAKGDLSLELNTMKLFEIMTTQNIKKFDLTFIDGSHSKNSFMKDLQLAQLVTKNNGYLLIDDIYKTAGDRDYEQHEVYRRLKLRNHFYEFDNWEVNPNMALIKNKDLVI